MQLVVDANILISFFRENPVRFIIINSEFLGIKLLIPSYAIDELRKNKSDVLKYSKLTSEQFEEALLDMQKFFKVIPKESFKEFESKAQELSPHKSDKDTPYFALALKLNCAIWSNEPAFKEQPEVEIFNTKELRNSLELE